MRIIALALALVIGIGMLGDMVAPVSYAQEAPEPEKPDKPGD